MPDDAPRKPFDLPDQGSDPVEWDAAQRAFVPKSAPEAATAPAPPKRDERRFYVGAGSVGQAPPPRQGGAPPAAPPGAAPSGGASAAPPAPPSTRPPQRAPMPAPLPRPQPKPLRRGPRFRRPKLRWIVLACTLLPILL